MSTVYEGSEGAKGEAGTPGKFGYDGLPGLWLLNVSFVHFQNAVLHFRFINYNAIMYNKFIWFLHWLYTFFSLNIEIKGCRIQVVLNEKR